MSNFKSNSTGSLPSSLSLLSVQGNPVRQRGGVNMRTLSRLATTKSSLEGNLARLKQATRVQKKNKQEGEEGEGTEVTTDLDCNLQLQIRTPVPPWP